jgi:hypothetical protein
MEWVSKGDRKLGIQQAPPSLIDIDSESQKWIGLYAPVYQIASGSKPRPPQLDERVKGGASGSTSTSFDVK